MAALHADGSVDISIPGVGIYPRVARSAVRLLNGAPAPAFALMVDMVAPRFGEASKPASVLREQGYPRTYRGDGQEAHGYEGYEQLLDQLLAHTLQRLGG